MDDVKQFKAFVSYSHSDQGAAHWLHNALETYRVPRHLVGKETSAGVVPRRLGSVFIDRKELSASDSLNVAVRTALAHSDFLIVVCSPDAARSQWVNQEITEFKRTRGEAPIRCLIVDGEPRASLDGDAEQECFPPALLYRIGADGQLTQELAEPIAADLRPQGDGKRMARMKLIAGLLDVGLDDLVQRETVRRQRRMITATAASVAATLVMSVLTFEARQARTEADLARGDADVRRAQAESLIEFMLVDLRSKLGPVERLDVLDAVGKKALDYYAQTDPGELDADSLARQARTLHLLGEIQNLRGDLDTASKAFFESQETTGELLRRTPDDVDRIYDHAQSTFWIGYSFWQQGKQTEAELFLDSYLMLSERLARIDPENTGWQLETGYGNSNMGALFMEQGKWTSALVSFSKARTIFSALVEKDPSQVDWQMGLANAHSWLSSALLETGQLGQAHIERERQLAIYHALLEDDPNNRAATHEMAPAHMHLARLLLMAGDIDLAMKEFERASEISEARRRDDPDNAQSIQLAGTVHLHHAMALVAVNRSSDAGRALLKAETITRELLRRDPNILKWQVDMRCQGLVVRAQLGLLAGDLEDGLLVTAKAMGELERLQTTYPENLTIRLLMARASLILGRLQRASADPDKAQAAWERTVSLLAPIGADLRPTARADLAWAYFHIGNSGEARQVVEVLENTGYRHPDFLNLKVRLGPRKKT